MKVRISTTYPPNIDAIRQTFGAAAIRDAVFTYGSTIHIPNRIPPASHLIAHEEIHVLQQGDDPAAWWERYLADPEFRAEQELEAYRAQYQFIEQNHDRKFRRMAIKKLSKHMASAMYGCIMTPAEAEAAITEKD